MTVMANVVVMMMISKVYLDSELEGHDEDDDNDDD